MRIRRRKRASSWTSMSGGASPRYRMALSIRLLRTPIHVGGIPSEPRVDGRLGHVGGDPPLQFQDGGHGGIDPAQGPLRRSIGSEDRRTLPCSTVAISMTFSTWRRIRPFSLRMSPR